MHPGGAYGWRSCSLFSQFAARVAVFSPRHASAFLSLQTRGVRSHAPALPPRQGTRRPAFVCIGSRFPDLQLNSFNAARASSMFETFSRKSTHPFAETSQYHREIASENREESVVDVGIVFGGER